jgi:hypothetical protein
MKKTVLLAAASLALLSGPGLAQNLHYNFVDLRYLDSERGDADGFSLAAQGLITPEVYVLGRYAELDLGPVDAETLQAGLGYRYGVQRNTDLIGEVSFLRSEVGNNRDNGLGLSAGVRHRFTEVFEGSASIDHVNADRNNTALTVGGLVHFTPQLAAVASYTFDDDDVIGVGGRFNF